MTVPPRSAALAAAFALFAACTPSPDPGGRATEPRAVAAAPRDTLFLAADTPAAEALPSAAERARGLEALRRGRALARTGDTRGAARAFEEAGEVLPPFRGWARVLSAEAAAGAGDTAEVRRLLAPLPPGPAREWGWEVRARALRERGDAGAAAEVAEAAGRELRRGARAAQAWRMAGELRAGAGEGIAALAAFRRAMEAAPESEGALEAARAALELPGLPPEDRLLVGRTLLAHGGVERGVAGVEAYLATGLGAPAERAELHLRAGRALFRARRYAAAERHLRAAAEASPEAAFLLGRAVYRSGRREEGREIFREVPRRFPRTPAAAEALYTLGDLEQDAGRTAAAREHYRAAVATGVHGDAAAEAAVRLAGIALLAGDPRTALSDLEAYLAGGPEGALAAPALYWAGRAALAAGDGEGARRRFRQVLGADPFSYHGVRAAERLGTTLAGVPLSAPPEADPRTAAEVEAAFFRIDLLRELEREAEAAFELARLRERMAERPEGLYRVAEGMIPRGTPIAAALLGRELHARRGAWDDRLLRMVYQFPFRELVEREARRHGLDPYLVAGLIRQESFFNPRAVSAAGAVGLMQVMPSTGRGLARSAGIRGFEREMLLHPETNVRLGTAFLADQLRRHPTLTDAFAAYNAGPGRVARWRRFPEHRDEDLFVERIPFAETRDYVKKVRFHAHLYRALYAR